MDYSKIEESLIKIYCEIPNFECKNCHKCCNNIIWFEPENYLIRNYLKDHNINFLKLYTKKYKINSKKCMFLTKKGCIIYPVRPIVCRLQGLIKDLPCKNNKKIFLSNKKLKKIKNDFNKIIFETNSNNTLYTTRILGNDINNTK